MHLQHDVVCPTLVGRDTQIAAVRHVLEQARGGSGRVALIVGEAGVGKSRLLRAMTDEARAAGFFILQGACFEAERSIPYAPLLDLVRLLASATSPAIVNHVLAPAASDLVAFFPELRLSASLAISTMNSARSSFNAGSSAITALVRPAAAAWRSDESCAAEIS